MDLTLPVRLLAPDGTLVGSIEMGGAEGAQYATIRLVGGDVIGMSNLQGGRVGRPNLDLGAGSDGHDIDHPRGNISLNYDVGSSVVVGSGRKRALARFKGADNPAKDLITLSAPVRLTKHLYVPDGSGGWRKAL